MGNRLRVRPEMAPAARAEFGAAVGGAGALPSASAFSQAFVGVVTQVGGSSGGPSTKCSFTYDVWPAAAPAPSPKLLTAVQPLYGRMTAGKYVAAASGTEALFWRNPTSGDYELLLVLDEHLDVKLCSCG